MRKLAVAAALCLCAATVDASENPQIHQQPAPDSSQVSVDADGRLRQPTLAEQQELAARSTSQRSIMLKPVVHEGGAVRVDLDASFDHTFVARTDEDGSIAIVCVDDPAHAKAFLASSATIDTVLRLKQPSTIRRVQAERE